MAGCSSNVPDAPPQSSASTGSAGDVASEATAGAGEAESDTANSDEKTGDDTVDHAAAGHGAAAAPEGPYCEDWPTPAVVIASTGQVHGYLEPCGCSEPQYGGISRRAALLQQLRDRGWPVAAFDLGGMLKRNRPQSLLKFQTMLAAMADMKYSGLAVGVEELKLGAGNLLSLNSVDPDNPDAALSFLGGNSVLFETPDLPGGPIRSRVIERGGKKIGVAAVFGTALRNEVGGIDPSEIAISAPAEALQKAVEELTAKNCDLLVLLSHARIDESKKFAEDFPAFQLVLSTGPIEEPLTNNPIKIGTTTLVTVGHKGKHVGVVGWYPDDTAQPFRFEMVKLDGKRFPDPPKMVDHMRAYQDFLQQMDLVRKEQAVPHPSGDKFVGAEKCGECHTKAFAQWEGTKHAHAFDSLRKGRRDIPRIYDPECVTCHVAGWSPAQVLRYDSGYLSEKETPQFLGVQCENCHGPGDRHIELVEADMLAEARKLMRVTKEQASKSLCYDCHDLDNSPAFKFETYWPDIEHVGLD